MNIKEHPVATTLRQIAVELGDVLYERDDVIEALIVSLLARMNPMLIGTPGIAKTLALELLAARVEGGRHRKVQLHKTMTVDGLYGPIDPSGLLEGRLKRKTDGMLPEVHIATLDEIDKATGLTLNALLMYLNEHQWDDDGEIKPVPLLMAGAATNSYVPSELEAFDDRFLVKLVVSGITDDSTFAEYLTADLTVPDDATTVALDDLVAACDLIDQVTIPDATIDRILTLRRRLADEAQCEPSDRAWRWSMHLLKAYAFYQGRDTVDDEDIEILRHALWSVPEQRETVHMIVLSSTSELAAQTIGLRRQIGEIEDQLRSLEGVARDERGAAIQDCQATLAGIQTDLLSLYNDAGPNTRLDDTADHLRAAKALSFQVQMGTPEQSALRMAAASMDDIAAAQRGAA